MPIRQKGLLEYIPATNVIVQEMRTSPLTLRAFIYTGINGKRPLIINLVLPLFVWKSLSLPHE